MCNLLSLIVLLFDAVCLFINNERMNDCTIDIKCEVILVWSYSNTGKKIVFFNILGSHSSVAGGSSLLGHDTVGLGK